MHRLILIIVMCFPALAAARVLETDKRLLCEAQTAFGWPKNAEFAEPEVWISRTKYVIEPAPQQMEKLIVDGEVAELKRVSHVGKNLREDGWEENELFFCLDSEDFILECYRENDDNFLHPTPYFGVSDAGVLGIRFYKNKTFGAASSMMVSNSIAAIYENIAFEVGFCMSF